MIQTLSRDVRRPTETRLIDFHTLLSKALKLTKLILIPTTQSCNNNNNIRQSQYLVELVNNLAHEHQTEAWLDLTSISGERQRVSGQFVQAIETASGLLAGATSQQHLINGNNQQQQQSQQLDGSSNEDFVKLSENVYVTIRSVPISSNLQNRSIEVSFPSETGSLGFWWMNSQQRFTLHLQAAQPVNSASLEQSQVDVKYPQQQQLEQAGEQFGGKFYLFACNLDNDNLKL